MTTVPRRPLQTPTVTLSRYGSGRTARAADLSILTDLINDSYGGHPAQEGSLDRLIVGSSVCNLLFDPRTTAKLLSVAVTAAWNPLTASGHYDPDDKVLIALEVSDGIITVLSSNNAIPNYLSGATFYYNPSIGNSYTQAMTLKEDHISIDDLIAAGLDATQIWRFRFTVAVGATAAMERLTLSEVSRLAVDTELNPQLEQPRGSITTDLAALVPASRTAYDLNRRTYHHMSLAQGAPLTVTSAVYAAIPNIASQTNQSLSAGVPVPWYVIPRRIKGTSALRWGVVYKTDTAGRTGSVSITTSTGTYTLSLPGSTAWVWTTVASGTLADAASDSISWKAKVSAGTLFLATFWVEDDPIPGP